jgi:hypothetical protein
VEAALHRLATSSTAAAAELRTALPFLDQHETAEAARGAGGTGAALTDEALSLQLADALPVHPAVKWRWLRMQSTHDRLSAHARILSELVRGFEQEQEEGGQARAAAARGGERADDGGQRAGGAAAGGPDEPLAGDGTGRPSQ